MDPLGCVPTLQEQSQCVVGGSGRGEKVAAQLYAFDGGSCIGFWL